jgi:hypothetical protein
LAANLAQKIGVFHPNYFCFFAIDLKNFFLCEKRHFFRRKPQKIEIITSTLGNQCRFRNPGPNPVAKQTVVKQLDSLEFARLIGLNESISISVFLMQLRFNS